MLLTRIRDFSLTPTLAGLRMAALLGAGAAQAQGNPADLAAVFSALPPDQQQALPQKMSNGQGNRIAAESDATWRGADQANQANRAHPPAADTATPDLPLGPEIELTGQQRQRGEANLRLLRTENPNRLDDIGAMQMRMPGFPAITLAGLAEQEAAQRLGVERDFQPLDATVTYLPVKRPGEGLKHYGYDLFEQAPSAFDPGTDVPVPGDYLAGPSDLLIVQLYGN